MDNRPIGFFDSGLGGLTSIPFLQRMLPHEHIIYFGDTARTPYGSKSPATIRKFSFQICDYLVAQDVKMVVIACNTISATCLDALRKRHPSVPIVGIIDPIVDRIVATETNPVNIGIIGTKATIASDIYASSIQRRNPQVRIFSLACPAFVPLVEEDFDDEIMDLVVRHYLDPFVSANNIQKLVMGCTHYPLLERNFHRLYPQVKLLNPSEEVILRVRDVLTDADALAEPNDGEHLAFASDLSENFLHMIERVFDDAKTVRVEFKQFDDLEAVFGSE